MDAGQLTDQELWQAFKQGRESAFAYIYQKYTPSLYSYGYGIRKDRQLIADCIQDLFIYLHQHSGSLGEVHSIKFYLFKSLRRRILDAISLDSRFPREQFAGEDYHFLVEPSAESMLIDKQTREKRKEYLGELVKSLPRRQREAIYLMYYERMSYQEIAAVMSLEVKTVYNLLYEALQSLRRKAVGWDLLLLISPLLFSAFS
jgi:RNA polymerase sigma-70 factor (ECF subfamily)